MKLSIITCTLNSEKHLQKCIDSIIKQNLNPNDFEHIFVDAYSTDKTMDIIKKYQSENTSYTIKIIQQEPKWAYNGMNTGIEKAKGKYIYLLNSDDYIYEDWLKSMLSYTIDNDIEFCFWNTRYVNSTWKKIWILKPNAILKFLFYLWKYKFGLLLYHYCCPQSTIYTKEIHNKVGYYNESYKFLSDWEFSIKACSDKFKVAYYDSDISCFLVHEWSLTSNKSNREKMYGEAISIGNKYFGYWLWDIRTFIIKKIKFILWFFAKK